MWSKEELEDILKIDGIEYRGEVENILRDWDKNHLLLEQMGFYSTYIIPAREKNK